MTSQVSMFFSTCEMFNFLTAHRPEKDSISLDGNKFFFISQRLVTQFIFFSFSNHICLHGTNLQRKSWEIYWVWSFNFCVSSDWKLCSDLSLEKYLLWWKSSQNNNELSQWKTKDFLNNKINYCLKMVQIKLTPSFASLHFKLFWCTRIKIYTNNFFIYIYE